MKEGWEYKKLGEIATYINGFPFKPSDWKDNGKPIIRIQNLTNPQSVFNRCPRMDIPEKYFVSSGDILISWSATLGVFEWALENALLNQHIFKVVFDKLAINKQFFRYAIMTSISEMSRHTNGATMKHIRKGDFDNIRIPYPPLSEQQSIVDYLDSAFAKIDAMKANAEKSLNEAKALFQASLKEMLEPKDGWEHRIFESCLVKVPKQVQVKSKDYKKEGMYPIVSQEAELISGYWDDETIVYKHKEPVVVFGDHTKNIKYIDFNFVVGADGTHILSTPKDIIPKFFYYALKTIKLRELGYARHYKLLKEKYIPIPSLSEQKTIVATLDSLKFKVDHLRENYDKISQECDALKQAILRQVFE